MSSNIYMGGDRTAAVAAIKADILATCFYVDKGRKVLDMQKVAAYLQSKFNTLATDEVTPEPTGVDNAAHGVSPYVLANALEAAIGLQVFQARPDYPSEGAVSTPQLVSAIAAGKAKTASAAAALSALYTWTQTDELLTLVRNFYQEAGVDSTVPAGTAQILDTRTYRYAYRTDQGEISKPSDASALVTIDQNDSVQLTPAAPPAGRFIDTILWYRSNTGASTISFAFVAEKAVALGLTFTDTKLAQELAETLPSVDWDEPPANLCGLRMHPGSFGVGFFDNTLCVSVQNRLYAWPIAWRKTTQKPIVGIEVGGSTIFVGTQGEPVLVSGADPSFLSAEKVKGGQPCRSARSIVATSQGFMYAGADGIALCATVDGTPVVSRELFTKQQWEALKPESIFAVEHNGCYIFFWNNGVTSGCYSLGIDTGRLSTLDITASTVFRNSSNGKLYAVSGTQIVEVFGANTPRIGYWKSPRVNLSGRGGFAWRRLLGDFEAGPVTLRWNRWFEDSKGNVTSDVKAYTVGNRRGDRVHAGKPSEYEIELEGQSAITEVRLCSNSEELQS